MRVETRKMLTLRLKLSILLICIMVVVASTPGENTYQQIRRLSKKKINDEVSGIHVQEIVKRVEKFYKRKDLAITDKSIHYRCHHGRWQSHLPMSMWDQTEIATTVVLMTPTEIKTDIAVKNKPVCTLLFRDGTYYEFRDNRWTSYSQDLHRIRLSDRIDGDVQCETGIYRHSWLSTDSEQMKFFLRTIRDGVWLGKEGHIDIVLNYHHKGWDFFFVDEEGFITRWCTLYKIEDNPDYNILIKSKQFTMSRTPKIMPPDTNGWQYVTDAESFAECGKISGVHFYEGEKP